MSARSPTGAGPRGILPMSTATDGGTAVVPRPTTRTPVPVDSTAKREPEAVVTHDRVAVGRR